MTTTNNGLDFDALAAVAEAATTFLAERGLPWHGSPGIERGDETFYAAEAAHIATFDPPTVLALIAEAREAERLRAGIAALAEAIAASAERASAAAACFRDPAWSRLDGMAKQAEAAVTDLRALIGGER